MRNDYKSLLNKWHDKRPERSWDDMEEWLLLAGLLLAIGLVALAQWRFFQRDRKQLGGARGAGLPQPGASPKPGAKPQNEADAVFHGAYEEGLVFKDDQLGYLYRQRPVDADDLTAIKGIGEVLAGRLNEWGVFQYRQIALWDENIAREFGQRLSFHERIIRDDWVGQSRRLWEQKKEGQS